MKVRVSLLFSLLLLFAAPALADKAPAAEQMGSAVHASHLVTHIYAYTDGWDGYSPTNCMDEGCLEYGHVHCYGVRMRLWDTPNKGDSRVAYYPGGFDSRIGPDTEFQMVDVVHYKNEYFCNVRVYNSEGYVINSGFVTADYIGCDCEYYDSFEEVPDYTHNHGAFSLK